MIFNYQEIIQFWFEELDPAQWWKKDLNFDAMIQKRFNDYYQAAKQNELYEWRVSAEGRLAEIIILDQFSRNIFRDQAESFANDAQALALSQEAVMQNVPEKFDKTYNAFLLMPYMHSESLKVHESAVLLFKKYAPANLDFEMKHKIIIERFGRYPHRNKILARESTDEEKEFLNQPNSSF